MRDWILNRRSTYLSFVFVNRQLAIENRQCLRDSRHLLPEELAHLRKGGEKVSASPAIYLCRQTQLCGQLGIRRPDVFITALARKPAIKGTTNGPPLFDCGPGYSPAAQLVPVPTS